MAGAALTAAGCGSQTAQAPPETRQPVSASPGSVPRRRERPPLAVARGGDPAAITAAAIAALGGMKVFVKPGDDGGIQAAVDGAGGETEITSSPAMSPSPRTAA